MNEIIKLNLRNVDNAIKLLSECDYKSFEDISDLRRFHNKLYQQLMIVKKTLETVRDEPRETKISAEEFTDFFEDDPFNTDIPF